VVDNYLAADPSLPAVAGAYGAHSNYTAVLSGLKYDAEYQYRVTGPGMPAGGFSSTFHTRPQGPVFSFIVTGDEGFFPVVPNSNPARIVDYEARIAHLIYDAPNLSVPGVPRLPAADLVLNTGDNVYSVGSEDNYRDFFFPVYNSDEDSNEKGAPILRSRLFFPVAGNHGKIDADALAETLAGIAPGQIHRGQPTGVSLTQATDLGAVYSLDEIRAVAEVAKARGLKLHMDGARFANATARLGCSPAEPTWRSGIDIMSFGATKNGGALCDAIVVFTPEIAEIVAVQLRRAGQVWSKMRFASAQLIAYVENGLWLDMARASNAIAARIATGLRDLAGVRLLAPVEANEIFLELPSTTMDALETDGFQFYRRSRSLARFVCRFDTTEAEADALVAALRRHLAPVAPPRAAE